jgi:hypothetical protein
MQRSDGPVPSPGNLPFRLIKSACQGKCRLPLYGKLSAFHTNIVFMHVYGLPGHRIFLLIKHVVSQPSFGSFCTSRKFFHTSYFKWNYMFVFISFSPLTMTTNDLVFISIRH